VIGRAIVIGEVVSPAEATFVVADVRRMWILLDVRKEDANLVRLGQSVAFNADGIPGQVQGQIDWISTEVDQYARTLQVRAEVNNPSLDSASAEQGERRLLRARPCGTGEIRIRDNPQAVVVPSEAVQFDGVSHIVFVRDGDLFRRCEVQPGATRDGQTEIVSGLKPGETVATVGSHVLKASLQLAASRR
jgi:cobalt-zinc-cadmium efflux system membrane fusion protein